MTKFQAVLASILVEMKESRSFLTEAVLKMYEENRFKIHDLFTLEALKAHAAFIGKMIDEKVLGTLVDRDNTMPPQTTCRECGVQVNFRLRWVKIQPDGSLGTFGVGIIREDGQSAILPRADGKLGLEVSDFCWTCRFKIELPKGTFFQSHIQAQKRLGGIRARAEEKRREAKTEKNVLRLVAPQTQEEEVEELTLDDLIPEEPASPAPEPETKPKKAARPRTQAGKRSPRKTRNANASA